MIPGPIDLTDEVLEALRAPVIPHYGDQWVELYTHVRQNLKRIAETDGDVFVLVGSGTAGIDAAIGSAVATGEHMIVVDNGFFSGRMVEIAAGYGIVTHVLHSERGCPVTPDELRAFMHAHAAAKVVALSQSETATGVLNDLEALGALVREEGGFTIVDAVSSFGAARIAVDAWAIGICCTASQKALEGPPGVAPVIVSPDAWPYLESKGDLHHGMYADLKVWRKYATEWSGFHPQPATMAVNVMRALQTSTDGLLSEGLDSRYGRYRAMAQSVRDRVRALGFQTLAQDAWASPTVTAVRSLDGLEADAVVRAVRECANIQIGGGVGDLRGEVFRIGHIGLSATAAYHDDLFAVLEQLVLETRAGVARV